MESEEVKEYFFTRSKAYAGYAGAFTSAAKVSELEQSIQKYFTSLKPDL